MSVILKESHTYAVRISDDVKDSDLRVNYVSTASVWSNPMHFISGPSYIEGDRTP